MSKIKVTDIDATGSLSATTYLDGSGAWSTPAGGGGGGGGGGSLSAWGWAGLGVPDSATPSATVTGSSSGAITNSLKIYPINNWYWNNGVTAGVVTFDFTTGVTLSGVGFVQTSATNSQGTWQVSVSNDNITFTNLGAPGAWGGAAYTNILFTNTAAYRYYRLTQVSGTTSQSPFQAMFVFKWALSGSGASVLDYLLPFGFTSPPAVSELMLITVFTETVVFADNFAGSQGSIGINPSASRTFTVAKNGTSVGTIAVSSAGVVTFNTPGAEVTFVAGDRLTITAPGTADASMSNCAFTLKGTRS